MASAFVVHGNFKHLEKFLKKVGEGDLYRTLDRFAREGRDALVSATPVDTGKTAASWGYEIRRSKGSASIIWTNSNVNQGKPIAILIQYGHGTGTGGYIQGYDYINPAMRPIFDRILNDIWQEVTSA